MAWVEAHGGGFRVRYRLPDGKVGSEPGYTTRDHAEHRALELSRPGRTPAHTTAPQENAQPRTPQATRRDAPRTAAPIPKQSRTAILHANPPTSMGLELLESEPARAPRVAAAAASARPRRVARIFDLHNVDATPPARPARLTGTPTLEQWVRAWAPTHHVAANTAASYDNALRIHILPALGHLPIDQIDRLDIKAFAHSLGTRMRPTSVHTIITTLSVVMNEAVDSRLIPANPCRRLKLPPREPREKVIATPVQILQIAARLDPLPALMVITGAYTGMRWGELAGLAWTNVRLEHKVPHITIPKDDSTLHEIAGHLTLGPPKTRAAARDIALPPHLTDLLRTAQHQAESPYVFTGPSGGWLRRGNFRRREWQPVLDGVPTHPDPARRAPIAAGMTFHALRHCHKTWMTEDQILESIQDYRLGHATPGIGARYTHRNLDMQKDITTAMDQRYTQSTHDYTHLSPALPSLPPRS